jgi:glycosyltransferase involved in cell wall biosynthesis
MPRRADSKDVVVVIPARNEAATVGDVVTRVIAEGLPAVVVDDCSTDATAEKAEAAGAAVLRLPIKLGVGGALRCGFRYAVDSGYRVAVQCDADGQHDPAEIPVLLRVMDDDHAHLVIGSRFDSGTLTPIRTRHLAMRILARAASRAAGRRISDSTSGFRAVASPLLEEFARSYPAQYLGDTFEVLVASARAGYRVVSAPAAMRERQGGIPSSGTLASLVFLVRAFLVVTLHIGTRYRPAQG